MAHASKHWTQTPEARKRLQERREQKAKIACDLREVVENTGPTPKDGESAYISGASPDLLDTLRAALALWDTYPCVSRRLIEDYLKARIYGWPHSDSQ